MPRTASRITTRRARAGAEPSPVLEVVDNRPRVIRVEEAADRLGVSVDTLRLWWKNPDRLGVPTNLPRPRQVGPNRVGVLANELDDCIKNLPLALGV
jgi:predicted DNA-binding transcriptional regulator AlpA